MLDANKFLSKAPAVPGRAGSLRRKPALSALGPAVADSDWARLDRFLTFGSDDGAVSTEERELTLERAQVVARCLAAAGLRTLDRIVAISTSGRAPKNDPATFSLALAAKLGDESTRRAAYAALPVVCRHAADLMQFAEYAQRFGGWGRGMRRAVAAWFNARSASELALQLALYPEAHGWSHRDLLRLAHPHAASASHDRLFAWATRSALPDGASEDPACALIVALDALAAHAKTRDVGAAVRVIADHAVPLACVPSSLLHSAAVWEALLGHLPMPVLLRSLAAMTRAGLLDPFSDATDRVAALLRDRERLRGLHPVAILAALVAYRSGRGERGHGPWLPVVAIIDALEAAFYASLQLVEPVGKRLLIALDISGSMGTGSLAGIPNLTPRLASAAMTLVTAATERHATFAAFTAATEGYGGKWGGGTSNITALSIASRPHLRLEDVLGELGALSMGGTDCALPMVWAHKHRVDVDTFVVYTDNETWSGDVHPVQALRAYRDARGIPAKLVVVGMTSNGFSVADPDDAGMLDVVGFDPSTPPVIADFARA